MTITYTVQLRYSKTNFLGHGPARPDGSHSVTFGTTDYLSEVLQFDSYAEALAAAQYKYINLSEDYVIISPKEQHKEHKTTYTVQLRHVPSHFYGTKMTPGKGGTTYVFDELHNLMTVSHFDSVDDALLEVCVDNKHTTNPSNYFTIRPYTEAVAAKVNRYEVWIMIPCKNGLRTYVLSGHNSFVPIMDHASDLQPLHFSSEQNAQKYADSLELTDYRVMQLSDEF